MTLPTAEFDFVSETVSTLGHRVDALTEPSAEIVPPADSGYPPPILKLPQETIDEIATWLDGQLETLIAEQSDRQTAWAEEEEAYRALPEAPKTYPFKGAANELIPVIAMAVDPIHARLDTGIFKQDPVFSIKPLKKSYVKYRRALEAWIDFYQKRFLKLRRVASPRLLECAKLGTMALKTEYYHERVNNKTYDRDFNVVDRTVTRFKGPKVFGISIGDLLFSPLYQHLQDCPIVAERQRTTLNKLWLLQESGKLGNVEKLENQESFERTDLEDAREEASQHVTTSVSQHRNEEIIVHQIWFDYQLEAGKAPQKLVATYHKNTRTFLQLQYNWYFHQRYPYTVVPYTVTNDSLYGIGISEMVAPFQTAISRFHQMASDNAYIANIRMFIVKKDAGIEDVPRLYAGRCFFVDEPAKDFIPFQAGDIYPSTLVERQNLFGLTEKRTGVSDYLTGRESPIIGSRATATSTLALLQEGTRRVEEVLENVREGFAEIIENCIYIWIQYGLGEVEELAFGDDEIHIQLKRFFAQVREDSVGGAIAIDLTATDAAGNRQAQQQMQLQIIQVMMQYLEKVLAAGQGALAAQQQMPQLTEMIKEVMRAARKMFEELLHRYDIRNPEEYLPDLEQFLNDSTIGGLPARGGIEGRTGGPEALSPMAAGSQQVVGPPIPRPATPGQG